MAVEEVWICKYYSELDVTFTSDVAPLFNLLSVVSFEFVPNFSRSVPDPINPVFMLAIATLMALWLWIFSNLLHVEKL